MKLIRLMHMVGTEMRRVLMQPWFWLAACGVAMIKFLDVFCRDVYYYNIFVVGNRDISVLSLFAIIPPDTFWWFANFCLCAFPVVGNFVQDYKNNRLK